jgi:hypothetical protein
MSKSTASVADQVKRTEQDADGQEARVIRSLLPEAKRSQDDASQWSMPHPAFDTATLRFCTLEREWEITGKVPEQRKRKGNGLVGFVYRGLNCPMADAIERINEELDKPSSRKGAQASATGNKATKELPEHFYFMVPAVWWKGVVDQGLNAVRVASHLMTTACARRGFSLFNTTENPIIHVPHTTFQEWDLDSSAVSRAVKRLVDAGLIKRETGQGRTMSSYTLLVFDNFKLKGSKSRVRDD